MRDEVRNRNPSSLPGLRTNASEEIHVIGVATWQMLQRSESPMIRRTQGWMGANWGWDGQYRELLYFLVWGDIKVRYKQTVLGVL